MVKVYTNISNVFAVAQNFTAGMTVTGAVIDAQSGITNSVGHLILAAASGCLVAFTNNQTYHCGGATIFTKLKIPVGTNCY